MKSQLQGAAQLRRLLRRLPDEARDEVADVLDEYGTKLLAAMRRDVPVDTGRLRDRLSKRLSRKTLQLRVGFVGARANKEISRKVSVKSNRARGGRRKLPDQFVGDQFYGRFVEFGRKAQTVRVTRRAKLIRITGNNRSSANRRQHVFGAGVYTLHVRAKAARPFVYKKRPELRAQLRANLAARFEKLLTRTATGAI